MWSPVKSGDHVRLQASPAGPTPWAASPGQGGRGRRGARGRAGVSRRRGGRRRRRTGPRPGRPPAATPSRAATRSAIAASCGALLLVAPTAGPGAGTSAGSAASSRRERHRRRPARRPAARRRLASPIAQRLLGADRPAGEDQVHRRALADQPRQPHRAAVDQRHAPAAAEHAERRVRVGDPQVAPQRQLQPARDGVARRPRRSPACPAASGSVPSGRRPSGSTRLRPSGGRPP